MKKAAENNLLAAFELAGTTQDSYSKTEFRAMVKLEQLKLIGGLGFIKVLLRGKIINEIESEALWSIHPNKYTSMQQAAKDQGISLSEYSNIRDLNNVVFPYLTKELGLNLAEIWEEVGKSNFRELCPYLVRVIKDVPSSSRNVEGTYQSLVEDINATNAASKKSMSDKEIRQTVVEKLMEAGHLPNRQLRQRFRPQQPNPLPSQVVEYSHDGSNQKVLVFVVDDEQLAEIQNRMQGYIDIIPMQLEDFAQTPFGQLLANDAEEQ